MQRNAYTLTMPMPNSNADRVYSFGTMIRKLVKDHNVGIMVYAQDGRNDRDRVYTMFITSPIPMMPVEWYQIDRVVARSSFTAINEDGEKLRCAWDSVYGDADAAFDRLLRNESAYVVINENFDAGFAISENMRNDLAMAHVRAMRDHAAAIASMQSQIALLREDMIGHGHALYMTSAQIDAMIDSYRR